MRSSVDIRRSGCFGAQYLLTLSHDPHSHECVAVWRIGIKLAEFLNHRGSEGLLDIIYCNNSRIERLSITKACVDELTTVLALNYHPRVGYCTTPIIQGHSFDRTARIFIHDLLYDLSFPVLVSEAGGMPRTKALQILKHPHTWAPSGGRVLPLGASSVCLDISASPYPNHTAR